jgi:hypothetical protein
MKPMSIYELDQSRYKALKEIQDRNPDGITTGVFSQNDLEYIHDEIYNAIDLAYEEHLRECTDPECQDADHDFCDPHETTYLIGFLWNEADQVYDPDPEAEYSAIWNSQGTIQVVKSDWLITGGLCSPCYPGQVDANSESGDILAYSVPPDLIGYTDSVYGEQRDEAAALRDRIFPADQMPLLNNWIVQETTRINYFYHIKKRLILDVEYYEYSDAISRDNIDQAFYMIERYWIILDDSGQSTTKPEPKGSIFWTYNKIIDFLNNPACHWTNPLMEIGT